MTFEKERNLLRSFGKHDIGPNDPDLYDHNPWSLEAEAEASQHKERCKHLEARVSALEAASAENATQLRASEEERRQLTESLASAEALASDKAVKLQATQVEISEHKERCRQLEQEMATAEAKVAKCQGELRKVRSENSECQSRSQEFETRLARDPSGKLQTLLIENAKYEERCAQLTQQLAKAEAKLDETATRQVEAATYKERCRQLERQLAEAKQQAKHSSGGLATIRPTFPRHGSAFDEDLSSPESHTSDQLEYVFVEDDAASVLSSSSWFSVKPHCFMMDALFKTRSYGIDFFMMGKDLKAGSQVVAGNNQDILTVAKTPEVCKVTEVVILQAGNSILQVTPDHLVHVPAKKKDRANSIQYAPAGTLKLGDLVMLDSGEPAELTSVESRALDCDVLKISFEPDQPIAVFSCPPCILSKCHKKPSLRRGGMSQRSQGVPDQTEDGRASIPITAGEYMD